MRKKLLAVILCASMLFPASVSAEVLGYEATLDTYTKEKKNTSAVSDRMMGREIQ